MSQEAYTGLSGGDTYNMTQEVSNPLNIDQQAASDGFLEFMFSDDKYMKITGPGGVGKSFLLAHMIDSVMVQYFEACSRLNMKPVYHEAHITAIANQPAEVLSQAIGRPVGTIHSFLGLMVYNDNQTGVSKIQRSARWTVHQDAVIFLDEAYMADRQLLKYLDEGTLNCKVVFIGDHCQLGPVNEAIPPVHKMSTPEYRLTIPMRTDNVDLQALNQQLRNTVETGIFEPIKLVPGVIDHLTDEQLQFELDQNFQPDMNHARIAAWTNRRVNQFNEHIRDLRHLPSEYQVGDILVNNQAAKLGNNTMLSVQAEVEILQMGEQEDLYLGEDAHGDPVHLAIKHIHIRDKIGRYFSGVKMPMDRSHYFDLIKWYQSRKMWERYYFLKERFVDLRPREAGTVHKLQGSTTDVIFVDVGDLSGCHNPAVVSRLLYVGASRARKRVCFYGDIASKYGTFV